MAGGFMVEGGPVTGGYNGRVTVFVILSCIVAGSGGILFGYDLGISGIYSNLLPSKMSFIFYENKKFRTRVRKQFV
jgi:hypothetical protein